MNTGIIVPPTICVVIPCYNRAEELRRALRSLADQSDRDFCVVVCDDGSQEDISAIVAQFTGKFAIDLIRIENSGGPARPRNIGIQHAHADWISFLDSDDWWLPHRMAAIRPLLQADVDVVYHPLIKTFPAPSERPRGNETVGAAMATPDPLMHMIVKGNPLATSGTIVRRPALLASGGFYEGRDLASVEDFDLWLRLAASGARFSFVPETLGAYWIGSDQISRFDVTQYERQRALFERQLGLLPPRYVRAAAAAFHYLLGSYAVRLGLPTVRDHFRQVDLGAGLFTWLKARLKGALWRVRHVSRAGKAK